MIKITENQKNRLKNVLGEQNYNELMQNDIADFFTDLHLFIIGYMDKDYNSTKESDELQRLYDEIYNLNEEVDDF